MSLNCNLNPNLKALEDKKAALTAQMGNLPSLGAAGMSGLIAAANAQKSALLASIPAIEKIPNFQEEIDALKTQALANLGSPDIHKKIREIENKWGNAIPDISSVLSNFSDPTKLLNINALDPCGSVPNISGKLDENGQFIAVQEPATSTVQTENAKEPEPPQETPLKSETVEIDDEVKANNSDIHGYQSTMASRKIDKAVLKVTKVLSKKIKKLNRDINRYTKTKHYKDTVAAIPKIFVENYNNKVKRFEYYILEAPTVPKQYDEYLENFYRRSAYQNVLNRITLICIRIKEIVGYPTVVSNEIAWDGTQWAKKGYDYEKLISKYMYDNAGFGLLVNKPDYGLGIKNAANTQDAKQYIKGAFILKPNDYRAAFQPKIQNITSMRKNTYIAEEYDFSNTLWDAIRAMFEVEYEGKNAMRALAAYDQGILYGDTSIPTAEYFIPRTMGGKLKNYEDYIALNTDYDSINTSMSAYSQASFKPHYMYRKRGTEVETVFAKTYQEHADLAQLGYGHNLPT